MRIAFAVLIISMASTPLLAIDDGTLLHDVVAILGLVALAAAAIAARAADVIQTAEIV